jgi:hypothetical protein
MEVLMSRDLVLLLIAGLLAASIAVIGYAVIEGDMGPFEQVTIDQNFVPPR